MENVKITGFQLEESKVNKGSMSLVAIDEYGNKWVIGGQHQDNNYAVPYELSWDGNPDAFKQS